MNTSQPAQGASRAILIGLALLFVMPVLLAAFFYVRHEQWAPTETSHGELIHPARPVEQFELITDEGEAFTLDDLRGRWTLIHIGGGRCGTDCSANLYKTRQAHIALGKDYDRLQRLYLAPDTQAAESLAELLHLHPRLTVAMPRESSMERILPMRGVPRPGELYLIDPHANLMMRYAPGISFDDLLEDLEHLLEVSRIG